MNYSIKINLLKLKDSALVDLKGKTGTKRCVVIPVDENDSMFVGEKGVYLSMLGIELTNAKFDDTHCIKPSIPKEIREKMSEEERNAIPIVGNMRSLQPKEMEASDTIDASDNEALPF